MFPRNQRWIIGVILVLLAGLSLLGLLDKPRPLPAVTILPPTPLAVKSGRVPDRWIPAKWTWLQKTCQRVFGPPRQVGFNVHFIEVSETVASVVAQNSLGEPQAQSNGLACWILSSRTWQPAKNTTTNLGSIRIITADRSGARAGAGGNHVDLFPRLEVERVDLFTRLIVTSAAQTNFVAAARAQLPFGKSLFLLDVRQPESISNRLAAVITADEYDAKGNMISGKTAGR